MAIEKATSLRRDPVFGLLLPVHTRRLPGDRGENLRREHTAGRTLSSPGAGMCRCGEPRGKGSDTMPLRAELKGQN